MLQKRELDQWAEMGVEVVGECERSTCLWHRLSNHVFRICIAEVSRAILYKRNFIEEINSSSSLILVEAEIGRYQKKVVWFEGLFSVANIIYIVKISPPFTLQNRQTLAVIKLPLLFLVQKVVWFEGLSSVANIIYIVKISPPFTQQERQTLTVIKPPLLYAYICKNILTEM
ncbi:hypothetical protein J6590_084770 [Homalodisca vitripennis]|nr:hypothetical protein J6590_084770 [Homalodisca vitripennis]